MEAHSGFGAPQSQQISLPVKKMQKNGIIFVSGRSILLKTRKYVEGDPNQKQIQMAITR